MQKADQILAILGVCAYEATGSSVPAVEEGVSYS